MHSIPVVLCHQTLASFLLRSRPSKKSDRSSSFESSSELSIPMFSCIHCLLFSFWMYMDVSNLDGVISSSLDDEEEEEEEWPPLTRFLLCFL